MVVYRWRSSYRRLKGEEEGRKSRTVDSARRRYRRHVPFELVGKVASAGAVTETSDIESST